MIFLVTGDIGAGKTHYMQSLYREIGGGNGFICPKKIENGKLIRYNIQCLRDDESLPFAYPIDALPKDWNELYRFGKYSFSTQAIQFAEKIVQKIINEKTEPFFIDEIGPLEIENHEGLFAITKIIIESGLEGFITVRKELLDKFIETFQTEISKFIPVGIDNHN